MDLYLVYSQIYDLSLHPTGSLLSFSNKIDNLKPEYIKSLSKLKLFLPQSENGIQEIEQISQITREYNEISEECIKIDKEEERKVIQAMEEVNKKRWGF